MSKKYNLGFNQRQKIDIFFATWFYSGLIPPPRFMNGMAGTYGSFFSLPLCFVYVLLTRAIFSCGDFIEATVFSVFLFLLLFYFAGNCIYTAEKILGPLTDWRGKTKDRDQNQIVIDETLGMIVATLPITFFSVSIWSWEAAGLFLISFLAFRLFDIVKIWPANYFDTEKTVFGVLMDDVVAGAQAAAVLLAYWFIF